MREKTKGGLDARALVVLVICVAGLGLPVTGMANHLYALSPLTVERHAWMSAHNALGILFVAFSVWHVVLNRRALWKHLRSAAGRVPGLRREALLAGTIVAFVLLLFVGHAFHASGF